MGIVMRPIICFMVLYFSIIFVTDAKKIQNSAIFLNENGKGGGIKQMSGFNSDETGGLIKKRKKRLRVQNDESKPSQSRQIVNIESFLNQFNLFNFSAAGSSSSDQTTPTSLPSFGSVLGYGTNGSSSPTLFILRARREIARNPNLGVQYFSSDGQNLNSEEKANESCFMIAEEGNKANDRNDHRYLKLSPCKKLNSQEIQCNRKLELRTKNNIDRKVTICSNHNFDPCTFVSIKSLEEASSSANKNEQITRMGTIMENTIFPRVKVLNYVRKQKATKRMCEKKLMKQLKNKLLSFVEQYF